MARVRLPSAQTATKSALVSAVKFACGLSVDKAEECVAAMLEEIEKSLVVPGDRLVVRGFGTFEVRVRAARKYRDPFDRTKIIEKPAVSFVHFKGSDHVSIR